MSIRNDFSTGDISQSQSESASQWANDVPSTQSGLPPQGEAHHGRHHKASYNCMPCRQKNARDFLAGNTPGVMAFYAPEEQCRAAHHPTPQPANIIANTRPDNATVEDDETVQRLVEWREEASY